MAWDFELGRRLKAATQVIVRENLDRPWNTHPPGIFRSGRLQGVKLANIEFLHGVSPFFEGFFSASPAD
jgi:hypothetical protein